MKSIQKMDSCTGCRACEYICPKRCISFSEDDEGFIYPAVDKNKCIECGLCKRVCHALETDKANLLCEEKNRQAWYGWSLDDSLHRESSSGGAVSEIVSAYMKNMRGGVVGAAYSDDYMKVEQVVCTQEQMGRIRKSKYVFCDTVDAYTKVKKMLVSGERVVYTGTPCQVAGLRRFLRETDQNNLLTIDFICHGVPSPKVYRNHIRWIAKGSLKKVDFRSKRLGARHCLLIEDQKGEHVYPYSEDMYFGEFLNNKTLRKCCYICQYSQGAHVSDFTLADFWGIQKYDPSIDNSQGISLIVANTIKAKSLMNTVNKSMHLVELDDADYNYVYITHEELYSLKKREKFFAEYRKYGYIYPELKMTYHNYKRKLIRMLRRNH